MNRLICNSVLLAVFILIACQPQQKPSPTLEQTMDGILLRFYGELSPEVLKEADEKFILDRLTEEEKTALATQYWHFTVNVPATVSIMRHVDQQSVPFWLDESGFVKTELVVKNEAYTYEVWRKEFPAGKVNLGVSGLENHRTPYFVSVGKSDKSTQTPLQLSEFFPDYQKVQPLAVGSPVYTCWELEITDFPTELEGDLLLSSNRGRPRESHLVHALRETAFPSSERADQISLSWSGDTETTQDIQWRTSLSVPKSHLDYWVEGSGDTNRIEPEVKMLHDRLVYNDPKVNRHSVQLKDLLPGTPYAYQITSGNEKSEVFRFKTAYRDDQFTFIWTGDSHHSKQWGELIQKAEKTHPEAAFYSIAGDIVTHGLYRNEWDDIFGYTGRVLSEKPLMPVPGNHDNQDDLGNQLYYDLWSYPLNGPKNTDPESSYSFVYENALFLMIDATQPVELITPWIEAQLQNSNAQWKFAMFHFPPYNWEEPYLDIQTQWIPLFDRYHIDLVMGGHLHYYMRSKPMNAGQVVEDFSKGTVYAISIGIDSNPTELTNSEPYAAVRENQSQYYQTVEINGNELQYTAYNQAGQVVDQFAIKK